MKLQAPAKERVATTQAAVSPPDLDFSAACLIISVEIIRVLIIRRLMIGKPALFADEKQRNVFKTNFKRG